MNRYLLSVSLALSLALLVPTGAIQLESFGVDEPDGMANVELAPSEGPNGEYAVLDDGEIKLVLSDENPHLDRVLAAERTTTFRRVFTITYTGQRSVEVWISDDSEHVDFFYRSDESIENVRNSVRLGPDETVRVGLSVDTSREEAIEDVNSFSVRANVERPTTEAEGSDSDDSVPDDSAPDDSPAPTETPATTKTPTPTGTGTPTDTGTSAGTGTRTDSGTPTGPSAGTPSDGATNGDAGTTEPPLVGPNTPEPPREGDPPPVTTAGAQAADRLWELVPSAGFRDRLILALVSLLALVMVARGVVRRLNTG